MTNDRCPLCESSHLSGTCSDKAVEIGQRLARRVFANRGNHSEVHLTELELAALLGLAADQFLDVARSQNG
jgi:hypothetical protein